MRQYFGTDGVRGEANRSPMNAAFVLRLGMAAAHLFKNGSNRHQIVIGKDTRRSGYMLEAALVAGITAAGVDVIQLGPLPTPGIAYLTKTLRADAGVVLSASHNPYYDNGIKFFDRDGFKLDDSLEARIEELLDSPELERCAARRAEVGRAKRVDGATERYIEYCKSTFPRGMSLEGLRIVVDCANGAAYKVAPQVFAELGGEVIAIHDEPNGLNINDKCGATDTQSLADKVREVRADIGIALDGDADRLILIDNQGDLVDGDRIIGIAARALLRSGQLRGGAVVTTLMSNIGLERYLDQFDIKLIRTQVGDRYVLDRMRYGGFNLGGEQSGHMIFLDYSNTGDGIVSALQVLSIMVAQGRHIRELADEVPRFPQVLVNRPVAGKPPIDDLGDTQKLMAGIREQLGAEGRILVRYSGTENKVRVMLEGQQEDQLQRWAEDIAQQIEQDIIDITAAGGSPC